MGEDWNLALIIINLTGVIFLFSISPFWFHLQNLDTPQVCFARLSSSWNILSNGKIYL